ncbi:hypothetical protein GCM10025792_02650 [Pseudonocardia tropica]
MTDTVGPRPERPSREVAARASLCSAHRYAAGRPGDAPGDDRRPFPPRVGAGSGADGRCGSGARRPVLRIGEQSKATTREPSPATRRRAGTPIRRRVADPAPRGRFGSVASGR